MENNSVDEEKNSSDPRASSPPNAQPCPACQCDGTIEGHVGRLLIAALLPIANAYPDDPGTSDLYDDEPVKIYLGDVRRAWSALRQVGVKWK
jgi:hypothetical protein